MATLCLHSAWTLLPPCQPRLHSRRKTGADRTFQLAAGRNEYLPHLAANYHYITYLQWLIHFGIFALASLTGRASYSMVAASANVSEKQLKTVARMALMNNSESEPNIIVHTANLPYW
ncbi:hypothetical protein EYZ11_012069 [Aspergillus tanneri]|uniref:Uncharacterized protein n=1 Tax=Aspergillus tanneri TaxID=1220188 RepID=A0A4S3J159_9EURO|nr:hypothetical protein EYZ11_012069 [Aspergillus tanneri]